MRYARFMTAVLVAAILSTAGLTAESKPATEKKAEAKVDKTVAKPKQEIQRFWVTPEMLIMWSKDGPVHDVYVLQTEPSAGFPLMDNPNARRLFSNDNQEYGLQLGGRLTFGMWADDARKWGFELSGFALEEKEASWTYAGSGPTRTGVSFLDTETGTPSEGYWNVTGLGTTGSVRISSNSQLWGAEGSGLYNFKRSDTMSLDFSLGVKHLDLSEDFQLSIRYDSAPDSYASKDRWETNNGFYGAKLGMKFNMTCWDRLLLNIEPAVSLGANCESLEISGMAHNQLGGVTTIRAGGGFTGCTNLGDYDKTKFAVVPEIKLGLGCKITKNISFNANYNFMYVSDVVRPGEQFNRRVNPLNAGYDGASNPGVAPLDPRPRFETTDYWAHGVGVNLKIKF